MASSGSAKASGGVGAQPPWTDDPSIARCPWCAGSPLYRHYHDTEWGFPVDDERRLFEKVCLEGFQAGLSWITILKKRDAFRAGFANFEAEALAQFDAADIKRLLADAGIVRHEGKIVSTINNARRVLELRREFGSFAAYVWAREEEPPMPAGTAVVPAPPEFRSVSPASIQLSKDLKKRGWSFVGPTTMYAFMQAMGLVNDHLPSCASRKQALAARAAFAPPGLA
ncbi:MAG: DNA-3-methyladenine glycosylase I [Pseudomonadota bacterium]